MKAKKMTLELKKLTSAIKLWQLACAGLMASQIAAPAAYAAPKGGVVVGGDGTIDTKDLTTIIDQKTDLLAIDWDSFNLSEEELVKFLQPDSSSIVLNRILDQSPSEIRGAIEANGNVILANPRGVLFTETATINVGAITAAGLDMDPNDFMSGNFAFKGESGSAGYVVNRGVINASSAALVGKQVTNAATGLISADLVSLTAADEAVLTFDADGLIGIKITKEVMENELGVDSAVLNKGSLDGKQVLMEAKVSGDLFTSAVNNEGAVRARGIDTSGGKIRLFGSGSSVVNSGELNVSGTNGGEVAVEGDSAIHSGRISARGAAGEGGQVQVLGDQVVVAGHIDASGTGGGGEVLIGGDYQGANGQVRNAETTTVTDETEIVASGIGNSDGGKVIVWADDSTYFAGSIRAESGELGGDGGFVETSGKVTLSLDQEELYVSTLSRAGGETGEWLLDPGWLDISDTCTTNCVSTTTLESALESNNVTIIVSDANTAFATGQTITDDGDPDTDYADGIRVSSDLTWGTATELTLNSFSNIQIESGVTISAANGDLSMIAGSSLTNSGSIDVNNFSLAVGTEGLGSTNSLGSVTVSGAGQVAGGAGADSFTLSSADDVLVIDGDNAFTLAGNISFDAVDSVDTGTGSDTVTGVGADWILNGTGGVESSGITFVGAEEVNANNAGLIGTAGDDGFALTATGEVVADGMQFGGLIGVDGLDGADTLDAGAYVDGLELTENNNQVSAGALLFSNIESATAGSLSGSAGDDNFVLQSDGSVGANGITFSDLSSVDGLGGVNALDASAFVAGLSLTGTDNQLGANSIIFSNIQNAITTALAGSLGADLFTITADNALSAASIDFTGLSSVSAGAGSDTVTALGLVSLTGNSGEALTSGISFSGIESVSGGSLEGSDSADTFVVTGTNALTGNDIAFSGISSVDAKLGSDSVTGVADADWTLTSSNNEAINSGITFTNVETLSAINGGLVGTGADESFVLQASGDVSTNGMTFGGLDSVDALGGTNTLDASAYAAGLGLTGTDNQLSAGSILFSNIQNAVASALAGSTGGDLFTITADNALN
ncbi:two-partner secretion domain-containing protein, partial [Microbulbifer sp.]|uniref:two-partner secretion domain-containing protein n=1 Tax=Microbulbifer sp. TaxID=1908541 RepID=UPI003F3B2B60